MDSGMRVSDVNSMWKLISIYLWMRRMIMNRTSSTIQLSDDILWEVLIRLPAKSLMRFKCVSKQWNSVIRTRPFAEEHASHRGTKSGTLLFYGSVVLRSTFFAYSVQNNSLQLCYEKICAHFLRTEMINGVIGFYRSSDGGNKKYRFILSNITTHELLEIPMVHYRGTNRFALGFDHVNQVYKVLRYYSVNNGNKFCNDICTIGGGGGSDVSWRSLDPPPWPSGLESVTCISGIIYVMLVDSNSIIAFDLNTETSKTIPFPAPLASYLNTCIQHFHLKLVQSGGGLALLSDTFGARGYLHMWIFGNNDNTWTEHHTIDIMQMGYSLTYIASLPTGEILLVKKCDYEYKDNPITIYKYDHIRKKLEKFITFTNNNDFDEDDVLKVCYYEEYIIPLRC